MFELHVELGAGCRMEVMAKVEIVFRRAGRNGRVEEQRGADDDAGEKLPIAFQLRMQDVVERFAGKPRKQTVKIFRAEYEKHHQPVVVRMRLRDSSLLPHRGPAAITADDITGP